MKFNKLYILALLGFGLAACSNEEDSLFEQSAAERLDAGQKEYFSTLCSDGGLWAMEYFANEEEPGYLFVMQFHDDKSVDIHTDHKWIGSTYKTEKSLWDVINDDGNVLTFNSYNTLFHVFSTPENIEGADAPTDTYGDDVDELGYGHAGDYEFMFMENNNGNIRLLGKKRGYYTYMRKLPADTDPEAYLARVAAKRNAVSNKNFPTYVMTETATGATYEVTGLGSDVVSIMPTASTNPFGQTETKACIITPAGMRPLKSFDCIRKDDSHFTIDEFTWAADGALESPAVRITAMTPSVNLLRKDLKTWSIMQESMSQKLQESLQTVNQQTPAIASNTVYTEVYGRNPKFKNLGIGYEVTNGVANFAFKGDCGILPFCYYGTIESLENGNIKIALTQADDPLTKDIFIKAPESKTFIKYFEGEFTATNVDIMDCSRVKLASVSDPAITFEIQLK
ncbi:MAG: DUF4302 domain-containing protein [Bacteroides sp.]|nr:DUF4302 domain-containing protein [Bacteroides sp.]MCM1378492.1 DUF4302 domain-containing protein [Bacteroides sp.]MCM1444793.1 DUF4302 domain-containing protein [Prevotella sp.]